MTGFARVEGGADGDHWVWEVKSVNGRNLEVRCRLPAGLDLLEPVIRAAVGERCRRGHVNVALTVSRGAPGARVRVNREALDQLIGVVTELRDRLPASAPPHLDALLIVPGVVELVAEDENPTASAERRERMAGDLGRALDQLAAMRRHEGARLVALAQGQLEEIALLRAAAAATAAGLPEALKLRLKSQLQVLLEGLPALSEERLAQEAALVVARGDIREELDRLAAHGAAALALIEGGGPAGRKLDFLCQELNREANTLCSKSADVELTSLGLGLKAAIEQLREQVQNIE